MNQRLLSFGLALATLPLNALAVEPGDARAAVLAELGAPTGSAAVGENTILFFARGDVQLREGRVVAVNLISEADIASRQAAEAAALERMAAESAARLTRLETEGRAVYVAKKSDSLFTALPAEEQLTYWRSFATRYPMISVAADIAPLMERVDHERRLRELEAANEARLAELESRLSDTEARARRAEREARLDRYGYYSGYFGHSPRPRPHHHPVEVCPPPPATPKTTPPLNRVDAARSEAMAEIEAARRRAYNGGVDEPQPEPVSRTQRSR